MEEEKTTENTHRRMQKTHTSMRGAQTERTCVKRAHGQPSFGAKEGTQTEVWMSLLFLPGSQRSCDDGDGERGGSTVTVTQSYIQQQKPQRKGEEEEEDEEEEKKRRERRRFRDAARLLLLQERRFQRCSSRAAHSSEFRQKISSISHFPQNAVHCFFFFFQYINVSICLSGFPLATLIT